MVAVLLIGPLTMFAGLVWAIVQPPLLVALVGLVFMMLIAPGLAEDLEREGDGPEG